MEGQIVKIISNLYFVNCGGKLYECHSRGRFRNDNITPTVGDYVRIDVENQYILEILPRKNTLIRPFVSNIDQAFIVTSCKSPDFSSNLLDKLLVMLEYHTIQPIICLTKLDLLSKAEKSELEKIKKYYQEIGYLVVENTELETIKSLFQDNTTVFTGQTGAGKSTLLNQIDSRLNLETGEISKALGRGKHTTRHVELIELFGGKVLDTPGFSALDFKELKKEDIRDSFIEFEKFPCPYSDCMHIKEEECAVKKAMVEGKILATRYENYQKFVEGK